MPALHEHAGLLGVIAAEAAFEHGDPWLGALIEQLAANRDQLGHDLAHSLPEVAWRPPQATYLAWLDWTGLGLGDEPAAHFLAKGRVALGRGLDYGAPGAGDVRVNFATSPEHLSGAVSRMARAVAAVTTLAEHVHRRLRVGGRRLGASRRVSHGLEQVARDSVRAQPPPWEPRPPQARGGAEHQRRRGSHTSRVARGERSVDNLPIRNQAVNADR